MSGAERVKAPIVEALMNAYDKRSYHFHIPGHTRGKGVYEPFKNFMGDKFFQCDMTDEFDGIGTLNPPSGPIREAEELCAKLFGAQKSLFLLNGSTVGNIAIAMALSLQGKKIIVNRNCHRSVLTGMIVSGAEPLWVIPGKLDEWSLWGKIDPTDIENLLKKHKDVEMVWLTNPTYEGVVSDIAEIAKICKRYDVPLVVDEAHGTLWKFNKELPTPSLDLGADIVVQSFHKTGGSMSQTSVMHIAKDTKFDVEALVHALRLLQTTSPSILLLAGLDAARANLETEEGLENIQTAIDNANYLRSEIDKLKHIKQLKQIPYDVTKIFIKADNLSGIQLETILEQDYNIEVEAASDGGLLILSNIGNERKDFEYLADCLREIDSQDYTKFEKEKKKHMPMLVPEIRMNLRQAFYAQKEEVKKEYAIGRISAEVIAECPPGIAILLPGELITAEHLPYLEDYEVLEVVKNAYCF
ncbi:MAG: aminotransferase class I/II-fold pyridoxal phosphate-dependent enzyme [Cyanobacteria bacterium RUI128]|nr:aminotransferase class I/II-fold pyridoxal phosphate-dependent enzyme [Cyanobacteria bacterium RUI128]